MLFIKKIFGFLFFGFLFAFLSAICLSIATFLFLFFFSMDLPDHKQLQNYSPNLVTRVFSADGKLISEYATEKRVFIPITFIPDKVKNAFLAAEDKGFYAHFGVDVFGIIRAVFDNLLRIGTGKRLVGASTITQQVAKVFFTGSKVSYARKIKEAILAFRLEHTLGKDKILELYLNHIYLGNGSYGVAIAAKRYFNKSLEDLTISECSYLAALAKGANNYHPISNKAKAIERKNWVIERQLMAGFITNKEAAEATSSDLITTVGTITEPNLQENYFVEEVRKNLAKTFSSDELYNGGLVVRTTQDTMIQTMAEDSLRSGLLRFERYNIGYKGPITNIGNDFEKINEVTPNACKDMSNGVIVKIVPERIVVYLGKHRENVEIPFSGFSWVIREDIIKKLPIGLPLRFKSGDQIKFDSIHDAKIQRKSDGRIDFDNITAPRGTMIGSIIDVSHKMVKVIFKNNVRRVFPIDEFHKLFTADIQKKLKVGDVVVLFKKSSNKYILCQNPDVQGAILVMNPINGQILALHGGFDFKSSEFNRSMQAKPQIGSLIKPFIYLAALDNGMCPSTKINARYIAIDMGALGIWEPKNFDMALFEDVTMREALERSINSATVRVARFAGLKKIHRVIQKFGIVDEIPQNISFILGACNATPINIARAYSMVANGGKRVEPSIIDIVQNKYGKVIYKGEYHICSGCSNLSKTAKRPPSIIDVQQQVIEPAAVYQLQNMLEGVIRRGSARRAKNIHYSLAGKTGTNNDNKAVWFVGFTPDIVAVVFVGYDGSKNLGHRASGAATALPIFIDFINKYIKNRKPRPFNVPPNIRMEKILNDDGKAVIEVFKENDSIDFFPEPDDKNFKEIDIDFDYVVRKFKRLYR